MDIRLMAMEQTGDGICVGTVDGLPLFFQGRTALIGDAEFEMKDISQPLLQAVDEASRAVFGPEWVQALALVSGLNSRTCQRDRIGRYGLPAPILRMLGEASSSSHPKATGACMLAAAHLMRSVGREVAPECVAEAMRAAMPEVLGFSLDLVETLASERRAHRAPALDGEVGSHRP
jgi:hypothetical protein